jgi:hypothetical protein
MYHNQQQVQHDLNLRVYSLEINQINYRINPINKHLLHSGS